MNTLLIRILLLALAVLLAGLVVAVFLKDNESTPETATAETIQEARNAFMVGDNQNTIRILESLIATNDLSDTQQGEVKELLAAAYIPVDYFRSFEIFKQIAADESNSPQQRSLAVRSIADAYLLHSRAIEVPHFAIFNDKEYGKLLDMTVEYPMIASTRNIYEKALDINDGITPMPIAHYRISQLYLEELSSDRVQGFSENETELLEKAKEHFARANDLEQPILSRRQEAYLNWLKAVVSGYVASIDNSEILRNESEDAFQYANALLNDMDSTDPVTANHLSWTNLHYALFMSEQYGADRSADIQQALQVLVNLNRGENTTFTRWLQRMSVPETEFSGLRAKMVQATEYNEAYKSMLNQLGWSF